MGYAEELERQNAAAIGAYDAATKKRQDAAAAINAQQQVLGQQYLNTVNEANRLSEEAMRQQAEAVKTQLTDAQNEQRTVTQKEAQKSIWGAATEFANALANLHYVGTNASNQQPQNYSHDWMKQADQNHRERKQRIDNIRERQRAAELQLAQIKAGNMANLGQVSYNLGRDGLAAQGKENEQAFNEAVTRANMQLSGAAQVAGAKEAERKESIAQQQAEQQMSLNAATHGLTWDPVTRQYKGDTSLAQAVSQSRSSAAGGGIGKGNYKPYPIEAYGDMDREILLVDPVALDDALLTAAKSVNDLPEEQQHAFDLMVMGGDVKADQIKKFIPMSATLREVVRSLQPTNNALYAQPASAYKTPAKSVEEDMDMIQDNYFK